SIGEISYLHGTGRETCMRFWLLWGIDAAIAAVVLSFFALGLADGSVSTMNIGLWITILAALAGVIGGSLRLRSSGRPGPATAVVLILAVPGILFALFFIVLLITNPRWN
ncbi:MAG TPA: hypothetical protein VK569_05235, partial [Bacteroidota bacterium]|nr:hypothetical protein [Bacteroidota bacterium]